MRRFLVHLRSFLFFFTSFLCVASVSAATRFVYPDGTAEADGRSASMELEIDGKTVKGKMIAREVCKTGIRLPKTVLEFEGNLNGDSWENRESEITGRWRGGDYGCDGRIMANHSKEGGIRIRMTEPNEAHKNGKVYLTRISSSTYGYLFEPTGKKYDPEIEDKKKLPPWIKTPPSPERASRRLLNNDLPRYGTVGPPAPGYTMPDFSASNFRGVIQLSYKETRTFLANISSFPIWRDSKNNRTNDIRKTLGGKLAHVYVSSNLAEVSRNSQSVNIRAEKEGSGQVWIQYNVDFLDSKGIKREGSLVVSWYVLIGKKALAKYTGKQSDKPESPGSVKTDLSGVKIIGKALRLGSREAAGDAHIYLVPQLRQQTCKSGQDGSFRCDFGKQKSGKYELMIQKQSGRADLPPLEAVELDLWPIKKYMVVLTKEKVHAGQIDVGTIWMERIGILCGKDSTSCRDREELRGEGVAGKEEKKSLEYEKLGDKLANEGRYREALDAYVEAKKYTLSKTRLVELDKKIHAIQQKMATSNFLLSGSWAEKSTKGIWKFKKVSDNRYTGFFRGISVQRVQQL